MDENVLMDLVDLYRRLTDARNENEGLELSKSEVAVVHDHIKAFFNSLVSAR